ncbi:Catechol 2,3-dioxygenase (plasmid) [Roseomonas mucosa]|nr:Catechol 2,3-dioxygenase [Roseomonas mucosa]
MNIIGPDFLVFGVDDVAGCAAYLTDFGLKPVDVTEKGGRFEALDGTGLIVRHRSDTSLPPPLPTTAMLRQQIIGVSAAEDLDTIEAEISKDRRVTRLADGSIEFKDDHGFELKFQVTVRRPLNLPAERINAPGAPAQRAPNEIGVWEGMPALPRTLSHIVLFVPGIDTAVRFYCDRLGFAITDVLTGAGPFLRPRACDDHHTHFFIQTPEYMKGCEHLAFRAASATPWWTRTVGSCSPPSRPPACMTAEGVRPSWPCRAALGRSWPAASPTAPTPVRGSPEPPPSPLPSSAAHPARKASPCNPGAGWWRGPSLGSAAADASLAITRPPSVPPSPSSPSPPP